VTPLSRRRFLGAGALGAVAVSCSRAHEGDTAPAPTTDLDTVALAAGMEKLAADTYTGIVDLVVQGRLGAAIPPAVIEVVLTGGRQHKEHLDTWNAMLAAAARPVVTAPNATLKPAVDAAFARLADVPGVATLALRMEDHASQTYLAAIPTLSSADAVTAAARILVVDQQHQAVLRYLLGLYPVGSGGAGDARDFAPADPRVSLITG
jgi:hypothetical protein